MGARLWVQRETLICSRWVCKLVQALWAVWQFVRKLEMDLPQDPTITTLDDIPKRLYTLVKSHLLSHVHAALVMMARSWEQPRSLSINECSVRMS